MTQSKTEETSGDTVVTVAGCCRGLMRQCRRRGMGTSESGSSLQHAGSGEEP